eukprot:gi/632974191/ref/XP_007903537.1/ PREDICTED: putative ankyrin repeat domain-containing protein 31 isoform X2 [Callorhinchus milii]
MNRMPLFNSDMKPSAATNNKLVVHSSNERTLGFKNDGFMLHEGDTQADDDLTQVTDYDLHSQSLIENENLGPTSVQLSADKNEAAADPSECEPVENIEKGQDIKKTSNSSHQDDAVKICIPRKSTRRRVNLDRLCFNLHVSQCHNSQPFQYSAERKRKAPSSDCEDLSEKLLNHRKTKRVQNSQHSARDCKNSNVPSLACIEFSQNVQTKKCANVQTKEAQFIKNTKTFMIQPQQGNRKTRAELRKAQNHKKRNRTTFSTGKADEERKKLTGDEAGSKQRSSQFRKIHTRSSSQHSKAKKETSLSCDTQSKARNNRNAENIVGSESSLSSLTASASSSFPFSLAHANRRNLYGETKLHIAVKNRDLNMLRAFIQAGVNVNLPDHAGWTPLHEASLQGFHEIVQELLSAGAEVNCKGDCGVTPLQDAAISGHYQHGAIAIQNADIGKCAQYVIDGKIKRLIDNQQQKRLEKGITKIGNKQLLRGVDFKNGVDCQKLEQEANCTTALHTDKGDIVITQSETGNDIVPTEDTDETMVFEPVISGHNLKETVTMEHQSNSSMPTCTMISSNKLNATPINLHSESKITVDNSSDTIGELNVNNSHVLSHSSVSTDQEAAEATNSSKAKEGHGSSKNSRSSNFVHSKWREFNHDTSEKDGPSHVAERNQSKEKTLNSTLHESEKIYKVQPAEVTGNMEMASKPSTSQVTSETSGSLTSCKKTTSSVDISTIRSINKKDGKGQSRLHLAVMKRDLLLVRSLIAAGIEVNMKDYAGWTALHEACDRGFIEGIQELLKAGADVNSIGMDGVSPLHDAVRSSHYEAVKLLLEHGANPNQKKSDGLTAFDEAENHQIRALLKTFRSSEATVCKQSQLGKGPLRDNSAFCIGDQAPPTLQNDNGSESSHHYLLQHKSIMTILDEVEKKQEGIMKELKETESIAGVKLKLAQMQHVLNEVLAKHKAEKESLVKRFRVTPGSFRQDILQRQLTTLACRQKRFLSMLHKKKALDRKLKECNLKLQNTQHNASINQAVASLIHITKSITTGNPNSSKIQHANQNEASTANPDSGQSGEICITSPNQEPGARQKIRCLNQTEADTTDNPVANTIVTSREGTVGCSNKINVPFCILDCTHSQSNMQTTNTSQSASGKGKESAPLQPIASQLSHAQMETSSISQSDCSDLTSCSSSGQNVLLKSMQCTNTKDNFKPNSTNASAQSRTEEFSANSSKAIEIFSVPFNNIPLKTSLPVCRIARPQMSQPKPGLVHSNKPNTPSEYQQQTSQFNSTKPSSAPRCIGMFQANSNSQCSMQINNNQLTSSQTNVSLARTASNCRRKPASECLPHNNGDRQRKIIHLIDLIKCGVIQPGENALELKLQGSCHKAELLSSGLIRSSNGISHRSPVRWMKALLGDDIPVNWRVAWNKVTYRGKELLKYVPMTNSSTVVPQSRPLLQSAKLTTLTDKTSSVPTQCSIVTEAPKQSTNMKSPSSFMQIREILLITNNELFPSYIIDQHWKHYIECDNWDF